LGRSLITLGREEIRDYVQAVMVSFPGRLGFRFREQYFRGRLGSVRGRFYLDTGCTVLGAESIHLGRMFSCGKNCLLTAEGGKLVIGDRVSLNTNVQLNASVGGSITIGDDVLVSPNVTIRSANHSFQRSDIPIRKQGHTCGDITIEDDVWLGSNVVVLRDVTIGQGAIIGAGAVVTHDIPPMSIAVGVPARPSSKREFSGQITMSEDR